MNNTTSVPPICGHGAKAYISSIHADMCYSTARFVINTVLAGIICMLGIAGNSISFLVLRKDKQTPVASLLLQALAVADNLFLLMWCIHFSVKDLLTFTGMKPFTNFHWQYIRTYTFPLLYVTQTMTIWHTVFIAFTRYMAVCRPYNASRICNIPTVRNGIITIALLSFAYNLPRFFEFDMRHTTICGQIFYLPAKTILGENNIYSFVYSDIMYYLFSFILPLISLATLNLYLIIAYRSVKKRRSAMRGARDNADSHRDPDITLVMIVVVLAFMVCNLPGRVVQIIWRYDYSFDCTISHKFLITELSTLLEVLNSSTNFIVYCVFRKQFRDILWRSFCECLHRFDGDAECNHGDRHASQSLINGTAQNNKTVVTACQETHF